MYGLELLHAISKMDFIKIAYNLFDIFSSSITQYMFPAIFAFVLAEYDGCNKKDLIEFIVLSFITGALIAGVTHYSHIKLEFPIDVDVAAMLLLTLYIIEPSGIRDALKLAALFICGTFLEGCIDLVFGLSAIKASALVEGMEGEFKVYIFIELTQHILEFFIIYLVCSLKCSKID